MTIKTPFLSLFHTVYRMLLSPDGNFIPPFFSIYEPTPHEPLEYYNSETMTDVFFTDTEIPLCYKPSK